MFSLFFISADWDLRIICFSPADHYGKMLQQAMSQSRKFIRYSRQQLFINPLLMYFDATEIITELTSKT